MEECFTDPDLAEFPLSLHSSMLSDSVRMRAFSQAIAKTVRQGDTVVDVGTGTGILAFLAARAGAREVVAIDSSPFVSMARKVKKRVFPQKDIRFLKLDARTDLHRLSGVSADVVICELLGNFGTEEQIVPILKRVVKKVLKPSGRVIPLDLEMWVSPVECQDAYRDLTFWQEEVCGIRFHEFEDFAYKNVYLLNGEKSRLLAPAKRLTKIEFLNPEKYAEESSVRFCIEKPGRIQGFMGWFRSRLASRVVIDNDPRRPASHWGQVLFPIGKEIRVGRNTIVTFSFKEQLRKEELCWSWNGTVGENCEHAFESSAKRPIW